MSIAPSTHTLSASLVMWYEAMLQACTGRCLSSGLCYGDAVNDNLTLSTDVSGVAYGGRGNDYFSSTLGAGIWFYGQEGDDTLVGNDEQTSMAGGRGADTFVCN
jgi:hypothetical protein